GLSHRHRELLGLEAVCDIEQRSRRSGQRQAVTPYGWDVFAVGTGAEDNTGRAAQSAASARDEEMDRVWDVVAEVQQRERAVMGEERAVASDGHPGLTHVVVLSGRVSLNAVETAAN